MSELLRARLRRESLITGSIQRTGQSCLNDQHNDQNVLDTKIIIVVVFFKLKESFSNDQLLLKVQLL